MSVSTMTMPSRVQTHARRRFFHQRIVAESGGDAHADQPPAVARFAADFGSRLSQPKRSQRPVRRQSTSLRCENRRLGSLRIDLSVVQNAKRATGSIPSFSAISSIAISSAIMPGASPGARIELPSGRLSTASRVAVMPIGAGIEQAGLRDSGLGLAVGQIARPALVTDGDDMAIPGPRRCECLWIVAGRCVGVVEHHRPRQRDLDRPSRRRERRARRGWRPPEPRVCRRSRRR